MNRFLARLLARARKRGRPRPAARRGRRLRLQVEALEARQVLSTFPITDLTVLAQQFPTHDGPTGLYLNFDGWHDPSHNIAPFTSAQRDQDIQDILYRASEFFAPFNVEVQQASGDGVHGESNGDTTVFIGDIAGTSGPYAVTPAGSVDYPGPLRGLLHQPNSDPFDVAYVDPFVNGVVGLSNRQIASAVAHEAGHTFGLAHVRTTGTDPQPLDYSDTYPDVMSYDSPNVRFINQTFNVTAFNYNGSQTVLDPALAPQSDFEPTNVPQDVVAVPIVTQNSYTYLMAVLGPRPADDYAKVTHQVNVDPSYTDGPLLAVSPQSSTPGSYERAGDYDVFQMTPAKDQTLDVYVVASDHSKVDPVLLIYEGQTLRAFNNDVSATDHNSHVSFAFQAGHTYSLVVGAAAGSSVGAYRLDVGPFRVNPDGPGADIGVTPIDPIKITKPPGWIDPGDPPLREGIFDGPPTRAVSPPGLVPSAIDAVFGEAGAAAGAGTALPGPNGGISPVDPASHAHGHHRHLHGLGGSHDAPADGLPVHHERHFQGKGGKGSRLASPALERDAETRWDGIARPL